MQNKAQDRGLGIFCSLFGLGVFMLSFTVKKRTVLTIGPGFMPHIIGAVLLLLGVVLTVQTVRKNAPPSPSKPEDSPGSPSSRRAPVLATFLLLILYVALLEVLGFTLTTALYLTLQFCVLAETRTLKRLLIYLSASVVGSLVVTVIFSRLLRLYLPQGIFR